MTREETIAKFEHEHWEFNPVYKRCVLDKLDYADLVDKLNHLANQQAITVFEPKTSWATS